MFKFHRFSSSYNYSHFNRLNIILVAITLGTYGLNRFFLKPHIDLVFLHNYFNDVLAGVLLISSYNIAAHLCNIPKYILVQPERIFFFTLFVGLFWEYVTPLYRNDSASDLGDVLAYICGGLLYWLIIMIIKVVLNRDNQN
ncbi:hypothetical protein A8L34_19350 [Bacillus sp. FJAT-27264]|nr:hypothetical protein A8L34_19350 [Bacillus sp. FJAT-27264]